MERQTLTAVLVAALVLLAGCGGAVQQGANTTTDASVDTAADAAATSTAAPDSGGDATSGDSTAAADADEETSGDASDSTDASDGGDATASTGTLSFYISDERNAIGDFDHLNVTVSKIGIQRSGSLDDSETADANETADADETNETETNETETNETETNETETSDVVFAINAGGDAYESNNTTYSADASYSGGENFSTDADINGTDDDPLYQTLRFGENFSYATAVENGTYEVTLRFAEVFFNESGKRAFDVTAENETVVSGLDVYNETGNNTAYDVNATVTVEDGNLDLAFNGTTNNAMVSAISVERVDTDDSDSTETPEEDSEESEDGEETEDSEENEEREQERDGESGGWVEHEVDSKTFDLTELQGANASQLTNVDVPAGEYNKVFIYVSDVEGVIDGESVNVKLPSQKLHLNKGFTVGNGEDVEFVYDITVFEAGNSGKYILKPVVSQSGTSDEVEIRKVDGDRGPEQRGPPEADEDEQAFSVEFVGNVTSGENATVEVTQEDEPLANATVVANGDTVGETGENGTLTFAVDENATALELSVTADNETVELTREFESETAEDEDGPPGKSGEKPGKSGGAPGKSDK